MTRIASIAVTLCAFAGAACCSEPVLLASRRSGWIEAFRLDNLQTAARVRVEGMLESVASGPNGERFYVRLPHPQAPEVCCALSVLNARTLRLAAIQWPALATAVGGGKVFTQRGDNGIEVLDAQSGVRLPPLPGPGVYELLPSPDGHWLAGIRQFPSTALDLFDLARGSMIRSLMVAGAGAVRGGWIGSQFNLLAIDGPGAARLWTVDSTTESLGQPRRISFDEGANCEPGDYETVAVGGRLAVYGRFPMKGGGHGCSAKGGYFLIDPANGAATARMAPGLHLAALTAGADNFLYGVDVADPQPGQMALVKLDSATGETRVRKAVPADVWHLSVGTIPADWSGKLDLQAIVR